MYVNVMDIETYGITFMLFQGPDETRDHEVLMAESSQLMPLINTGYYRGGTNDKPGPTI